MYSIALCDDEEHFLTLLEYEIKKSFHFHNMDINLLKFSSSYDCLCSFKGNMFDIIFLDINMPHINGFELSSLLKELNKNIEIIFITSLDDVVYKAFDYKPFGFIRKQYLREEVKNQVNRIMQLAQKQCANIFVEDKDNNCVSPVPIHEIHFIENHKNYINIHTKNGIYKKRQTMYSIEQELASYGFFRTHAGFIINIKYLIGIKENIAILENQIEIPISPLKKKKTQQVFLSKFRRNI